MHTRWRLWITLWLALALPLQGLAAASGLWCPQRGFHGAAAGVEGSARAGHGKHAAHAAHGVAAGQAVEASPPQPPIDGHILTVGHGQHAHGVGSQFLAAGDEPGAEVAVDAGPLTEVACPVCGTCGLGQGLTCADLRIPVDVTGQRLALRDLPAPPRASLPGPERPPRITLT